MQTASLSGKRYVMTIIDDYSRYASVYFLKTKDEARTRIIEFVEAAKTQCHKTPKCIRSDRGREFLNTDLIDYLKNQGISTQYTTPYTPQQNGVAERKNRSLLEMARCMLLDANLEKRYWAEAVNTANFLQNRLPSRSTQTTPYELWHSKRPHVQNFHVFGCNAYVHIPDEKRRKLDHKAEKLTFIGYSEESKAFRFIDRKTSKLTISRDAVFLENNQANRRLKSACQSENVLQNTLDANTSVTIEKREASSELPIGHQEQRSRTGNDETFVRQTEVSINVNTNSNYDGDTRDDSDIDQIFVDACDDHDSNQIASDANTDENAKDNDEEVDVVRELRRSRRENRGVPPDRFMAISKLAMVINGDPQNREEALCGPERRKWMEAMDDEIKSLIENETWQLVPTPTDRNVITCKLVFKTKQNVPDGVVKHKARLVARGFSQKYGSDYDEVFAPVVKHTTFRILLTIAGEKNMSIKHYDAKSAFLNGDLKETIYMTQPEGYEKTNSENNHLVCRLRKSLYGLKQAAKNWYDKVDSILRSEGFMKKDADPCLYMRKFQENEVYTIIHVDDFLIAAKQIDIIEEIGELLKNKFQLTDLGVLNKYLGIEVRRSEDGIYCIRQSDYINLIPNRFGLSDAKPSHIPLDVGHIKNRIDQSPMKNGDRYQQLIGSLLYLSINTRPDISASVNILSQYNTRPTEADWMEVKRICRYLKHRINDELILGKRGEKMVLIGFADADWAENREDRKSNSGFVFKLMRATISWCCRKQTCIALSSTEAEYIALTEACQEALWIRRLLKDIMGYEQETTTIFEDNQSCIRLLETPKLSNRTKHLDVKYHFVKVLKEKEFIDIEYCPTEDMVADMLTKPLSKIRLRRLAQQCGLN